MNVGANLESKPLLAQVLAERFPPVEQVLAELREPVPPTPWKRGGSGFMRWELLLMQARRAEAS